MFSQLNKISKAALLISLSLGMAISFSACKSKSTKVDAENTESAQAPQIDNAAMSFDAAGSDSGKIEGLETINFEYDKSNLSDSSRKKIQGNVNWMKAHEKSNIQIEGHCDARGSVEYNLSLGERRAKAVKDYMVSLGVSESRLNIISYGKEKPLDSGDSESAYAKNRRANFVPLMQ